MRTENEKLVDNFLKEIKKQLPDWLKNNDDKVEDILLEVSSHIWDSAQEISGSDDPDPASIQEAINRLGTPKEIAKSYKKRGTPKYFISEELWSIYTKVNWILISLVFTVIVIVQVVIVEPTDFVKALINGITLSYPIIITFIIIILAIFVGLSYEGYFPEDLGSVDAIQGDTKDKKLEFYKPDEFLFNGLVGILFGFLIIILPKDMINLIRIIINLIIGLFGGNTMVTISEYVNISMELQIWLTLIGIVAIITGFVNLLKINTKDLKFHLTTNLILIFTGLVDFGLSLYIVTNLHLFSEVLPLSVNILFFLGIIGVIGTVIDILRTVSKNIQLFGLLNEEESYQTS